MAEGGRKQEGFCQPILAEFKDTRYFLRVWEDAIVSVEIIEVFSRPLAFFSFHTLTLCLQ
jgi:hypothetical protein